MLWVLLACFAILFTWLALGIWSDLKSAGDIFNVEEEEL